MRPRLCAQCWTRARGHLHNVELVCVRGTQCGARVRPPAGVSETRMPTNVLRAQSAKPPAEGRARRRSNAAAREVVITAGRIAVRAKLLDTMTADRIWAALPL